MTSEPTKAITSLALTRPNQITNGGVQDMQYVADVARANDLDDAALQRDLGPMPKTRLVDDIRLTLGRFRRPQAEGRLDTADLT